MKHRVSIMACARWETPFIVEWLLYHRAIGFDHVYLYCNDDDPAELYGEVLPFVEGRAPFVTFRHFPLQGQQFQIYLRALREFRDQTEWVMFLDIDEFLCIRGSNSIQQFLDQVPPAWSCVRFNWIMFGNNGHRTRLEGRSVLRSYTRREERLRTTTKTLTRTDAIDLSRINRKIFFWHDWDGSLAPGAVSCNVLGRPVAEIPSNAHFMASAEIQTRIMERGVVHHYAFKSEDDFCRRFDRGLAGDFGGQLHWKSVHDAGLAAAELAPLNAVEDRSLADFWSDYIARGARAAMILPSPGWPNIALGKQADQSSHSQWSLQPTSQQDAAGAVSGRITGTYQFHTNFEPSPWWRVDLGGPASIHEIRVFNRMDSAGTAARLRRFAIEMSDDDQFWQAIAVKADGEPVGGVDGEPLRVVADPPILARFVRIRLLEPGLLHLDQVEVYGEVSEQAGQGLASVAAAAE